MFVLGSVLGPGMAGGSDLCSVIFQLGRCSADTCAGGRVPASGRQCDQRGGSGQDRTVDSAAIRHRPDLASAGWQSSETA